MKNEFSFKPEAFKEQWEGEFGLFSWKDFLAAVPSPIVVISTYKDNIRQNATLQAWTSFVGDSGEYLCILGSVNKGGHLYANLKKWGQCVVNFPSQAIYKKCFATVENNRYEDDEISRAGLSEEPAMTVFAPRIAECFLNMECQVLWEKEHFENSNSVVICLKVTHIAMDSESYDEDLKGRYGNAGFIYMIDAPRNPESGKVYESRLAVLKKTEIDLNQGAAVDKGEKVQG